VDAYERIRGILGRRPTSSELATYSVMRSEQCSDKSSKVHQRRFGELVQQTPVGKLLAGIGENAGVVDVGHGSRSRSRSSRTTATIRASSPMLKQAEDLVPPTHPDHDRTSTSATLGPNQLRQPPPVD
jgi:hypothetical protein